MFRKIVGGLLLGAGVFFIIVLLTYGGPVFPHVIGPAALSLIGIAVLGLKNPPGKNKSAAKK